MSNTTNLTALKLTSAQFIADGVVGNSLVLSLATLGFFMSTAQLLTIHLWKPIRDLQQTLVINAAFADALKSISFFVPCLKRLYLAAIGKDEVITQFDCMFWMLAVSFTTLYGLTSVLMLSMERFALIATPVWYWKNKRYFSLTLSIFSFTISIVAGFCLFIGVKSDVLLLGCTIVSSTTPEYYKFLVFFQDLTTGGIILVNLFTGVLLVRRWRAAVKAKSNMKEFKERVEFNVVKVIFSVVTLCLLSFFSGMIFMASIENFDQIRKAYLGPFWGCMQTVRGVFDFSLWLLFSEKYRKGFKTVFLKRICWKINPITPEESKKT